jgi:predicted nucleic acid-binding protein
MRTKKNSKREPNVLYIDANIFIFAALNTEKEGAKAVTLLQKIQMGEEKAITSVLTFDEVFWAVKKNRGVEKALETTEAMLNFPNLDIIPADKEMVSLAIQIIRKYNLAPRDALHAATAIARKVDYIVTTDTHFGKVKELNPKGLL